MAGVKGGGLRAMFGINQVRNAINSFVEEQESKTLAKLQYIGEEFVNNARLVDTYMDQTGNLRSSIGYVILHDGKIVSMNFKRASGSLDGETGRLQGMEFAAEVGREHPDGWVLIGVAGMDYAAAVEAKGYDVITGSTPTAEHLKSFFGREINS